MGRSLPVCKKLHLNNVDTFKEKTFLNLKPTQNLKIPIVKVYYIAKRSGENQEKRDLRAQDARHLKGL